MAIPDFQTLMRPLLELHNDDKEHLNRDLVSELAKQFKLTNEELRELLPSGRAKLFANRVGWAKTHISYARLITSPKRAVSIITDRGKELLAKNDERVDLRVLKQFPDYRQNSGQKTGSITTTNEEITESIDTPVESFEKSYFKIRKDIELEILSNIISNPPEFLEQVVVDLVVKMGYGGSMKDAGEAIGKSGDEGIDGIIKEDPLGLDTIYLQAKRHDATIGRPDIQKFAGALQGQRAKKGIFITTSSYSKGAVEYVSKIDTKIILIDGEMLSKLMFDHSIGVSTSSIYEVKRIDTDYFDDN